MSVPPVAAVSTLSAAWAAVKPSFGRSGEFAIQAMIVRVIPGETPEKQQCA